MRNFLVNIFIKADRSRYKSIAIPAIGTGNLRVPHTVVTSVMYDEVQKFSRAKPATTLKDIRFVVYNKDIATVKVSSVVVFRRSSFAVFCCVCDSEVEIALNE